MKVIISINRIENTFVLFVSFVFFDVKSLRA